MRRPCLKLDPHHTLGGAPALRRREQGMAVTAQHCQPAALQPLPSPYVSPWKLHSFENVKENSDHFPKTTLFTFAEPTCSPSTLAALRHVPRTDSSLSLRRLLMSCRPEAAAWGCAVHPDPLQLTAQPLCLRAPLQSPFCPALPWASCSVQTPNSRCTVTAPVCCLSLVFVGGQPHEPFPSCLGLGAGGL